MKKEKRPKSYDIYINESEKNNTDNDLPPLKPFLYKNAKKIK